MITVGIIVHDVPGRPEILEMTKVCLETLKATADEEYEIILIDNGSKTNILFDYLIPLAETSEVYRHPYQYPTNESIAFCWNNIIELSSNSDVILLLNNDVIFNRVGWMSSLANAARIPDVGMAGSRLMSWNGFSFLEGAFLAFRKEVALKIVQDGKPFDEQFVFTCEDVDFCQRLLAAGYRLLPTGIEDNGMVTHLRHGTLSWMTHDGVSILDIMHDSRKKLCRKYGMPERVDD